MKLTELAKLALAAVVGLALIVLVGCDSKQTDDEPKAELKAEIRRERLTAEAKEELAMEESLKESGRLRLSQAMKARAQADIGVILTALVRYQIETGSFPSAEAGLRALVEDPGNVRHWTPVLDKPLLDPWQNEYCYRFPAKHNKPGKPDVFSKGPDGIGDTMDDIGNW